MNEIYFEYKSENGYTGVMYGKSSFRIRDEHGKEVLHTGFRNFNTYKELVAIVEAYPEFLRVLHEHADELKKEHIQRTDCTWYDEGYCELHDCGECGMIDEMEGDDLK